MRPIKAKPTHKELNECFAGLEAQAKSLGIDPPQIRLKTHSYTRSAEPSEAQLQRAVIHWWRLACKAYNLPEFCLFHIPNGGSRGVVEASLLKAAGVRRGIPDLMLSVPVFDDKGLFIEMKKKGGRQSDDQRIVEDFLKRQGYRVLLCDDSESAIKAIQDYLAG